MAVETFITPQDFLDEVSINDLDLNTEFVEHAARMGSYIFKFYEAQKQVTNKRVMLDVIRGKLDKEIRERWNSKTDDDGKAKPRKFTETMVTSEIASTPKYITAFKEHADAEAIETMCKNCLDVFRQRKDMLVSRGANERAEMEGEVRMKARSGHDGSAVSRAEILEATRRRMVSEGVEA